MDCTLVNPNQLRHYGIEVNDNPYGLEPMHLKTEDEGFVVPFLSEGTVIYLDTWSPTQADLENPDIPHVVLSSPHPWDPHSVKFPQTSRSVQEAMEMRASAVQATVGEDPIGAYVPDPEIKPTDQVVYNMNGLAARMMATVRVRESDQRTVADLNTGPSGLEDLQEARPFVSKKRHTDVSPRDLSERWGISLAQAAMTLKATTQRFVRSAVMPIARRCRADRMFHVRQLRGPMATDTCHPKIVSISGNKYCQIFANKEFFAAAYPVHKKGDCGDTLKEFIQDFGAPDMMIVDGAKEQTKSGTEFVKLLRKCNVELRTIEPE